MKNIIDYESVNIHPGPFSLDKFFGSDAPGTLSWLSIEGNYPDSDILPQREIECSLGAPLFDGSRMTKQVIPCSVLCAGCKRWQIQSSGKMDLPEIINAETK